MPPAALAIANDGDKKAMLIIFRPPPTYPNITPSFKDKTTNGVPTKQANKTPYNGIMKLSPTTTMANMPKTFPFFAIFFLTFKSPFY